RHRLRLVTEGQQHRLGGVVLAHGEGQAYRGRPGAAQIAREGVGHQVLPRAVEAELGRLARALLEGVPHELVHHAHVHRLGHDAGDGDVVPGVGDDERGEHRLASIPVVLENELGHDGLDLVGGHHVAAHAAHVGLGGFDVALHEGGILGEDIRLVREDVRSAGDGNLLGNRHGEAGEFVFGLVIVGESPRSFSLGRAVALRAHDNLLSRWDNESGDGHEHNEVHSAPSSKILTVMKLISPRPPELKQMVQCLELFYRQGLNQKDIATPVGVSPATVSRLLKRASGEGLGHVEFALPRTHELEAELIQRFKLRDAVVVATGGRVDVKEELGAAAAAYFETVAEHGMRVGVSCGYTLYETIRSLRPRRFRDLALYPLSGESTLKLVDISPNTMVGMMAAKYRPHVSAYALPVQHLVSLRQIDRERRRLLRDPEVRKIYDAAQSVDVALCGIGMIGEGTPGFCALAESYGLSVKRLRQLGVVGEINY